MPVDADFSLPTDLTWDEFIKLSNTGPSHDADATNWMVIGVIQYSKWAWNKESQQGQQGDSTRLKNAVNSLSDTAHYSYMT